MVFILRFCCNLENQILTLNVSDPSVWYYWKALEQYATPCSSYPMNQFLWISGYVYTYYLFSFCHCHPIFVTVVDILCFSQYNTGILPFVYQSDNIESKHTIHKVCKHFRLFVSIFIFIRWKHCIDRAEILSGASSLNWKKIHMVTDKGMDYFSWIGNNPTMYLNVKKCSVKCCKILSKFIKNTVLLSCLFCLIIQSIFHRFWLVDQCFIDFDWFTIT